MSVGSFEKFIEEIEASQEREQVVLELQALQSIYEDGSLNIWKNEGNAVKRGSSLLRFEVHTALVHPHESANFKLLVTLPSSYPSQSPPQLQLLSRYIGPFQVDAELFGIVLKTYISHDRVSFNPGDIAVFDGIENVREMIQRWYENHLSIEKAAEMLREDEKALNSHARQLDSNEAPQSAVDPAPENETEDLLEGIQIWVSDPVVDRKSTFIGRACRISNPNQVPLIVSYLLSNKTLAKATHPTINAWRCELNGIMHQDNDDDGETAAGGRLAHLLQILELKDVLVVVTRYYGGVQLHGDRFKHINAVARAALEAGGFLDNPDDVKHTGKTKK